MTKSNRRLSRALVLGAVAALVGNVLPAQAQTADEILTACSKLDPALELGRKCDPNADVVRDITGIVEEPGLTGSFNVVPTNIATDPLLGTGLALEGTGEVDANGNPVFNIDFSLPSQVRRVASGSSEVEYVPDQDPNNVGELRILASTIDFEELLDWKGTIKDLNFGGGSFGGAQAPTTSSDPRVENFIVIDQPGMGTGVIDGIQETGIALDLVSIGLPSLQADGSGTSLSFDFVLQAYKLDSNGDRIEEQELLTNDSFAVYANAVTGRLSASIAGFTPEEVKSEINEEGELFAWYGYDITFDSSPVAAIIPIGDHQIPEPTTVISSLLLMGGGAFKFSKRKLS